MQDNINVDNMKMNSSKNTMKIIKVEILKENIICNNKDPSSKYKVIEIDELITEDLPKTQSQLNKGCNDQKHHNHEHICERELHEEVSKLTTLQKTKLLKTFMNNCNHKETSIKLYVDTTSKYCNAYANLKKSLVDFNITQYLHKRYNNISDDMVSKLLLMYDVLFDELPDGLTELFYLRDIVISLTNDKVIQKVIHSNKEFNVVNAVSKLNFDSSSNTAKSSDSNISISIDVTINSQLKIKYSKNLLDACFGGHEYLAQYWLSLGANVEYKNAQGFTPLIIATIWGFDKIVKILLDNEANMETPFEQTNDTPLSLACFFNHYEVCKLLLEKNANIEHINFLDYTPMALAVATGCTDIVILLLEHGVELNPTKNSKLRISPLMLAVINGHKDIVKLLLYMGSDIHVQTIKDGKTAIVFACLESKDDIALLILRKLFNLKKNGLTPLMIAAEVGYDDVGKLLIQKGVDVNAKSILPSGDTALTLAASNGRVNFVKLLLKNGACMKISNNEGCSPLWLAADGGYLDIVKLLYEFGADIDFENNEHVTCFVAAFRKGHVAVVRWMLHHDFKIPNNYEWMKICIEIIQA